MALPLAGQKLKEEKRRKELAKCVLAVAAGKGGVGKSMLSAHLATMWARQGYKVGLLDADLYGPSLTTMLRLDRPAAQEGNLWIPALSYGVKLMSLGLFRSVSEPAAVRAPIANQMINQFLQHVDWGELDYLILDFPPGTGDIQLSLAQQTIIHCACLIGTPQMVCLHDMKRARELFAKLQIPVAGYVVNMAYLLQNGKKSAPFGLCDFVAWQQTLAVDCLGQIPLDPAIAQAGDVGKTLTSSLQATSEELALRENFEKIAHELEHFFAQEKERRQKGVEPFALEWTMQKEEV